ncbi:hypothetical protein C1646_711187 [Rhizophagus diaphanus]|nr:hypothetical protein C1646_711187 [Rhizophagus diaphanus] [Rhizophagus sp. MUCL 43196]
MKKFRYFIFLFLSLTSIVHGCGMSVHIEVTKRAMYTFYNTKSKYNKYAEYIHNSPEFVQAGSFFPDWGFKCMGNDEVSEEAHWPPFMRVGAEYMREKYNNATLEHDHVAQGTIAFIFAIVSHGVADVTWHSIKMNSGFIRAMADLNFMNDYGEAHDVADTGGEFTLSHMSDLDYLVDKWSFPIDDLVEIYRRMNRTVDGKQIIGCARRAFAAAQANKRFGKHFFSVYGEKSPFLIEQSELYHKGGFNNMAADVADCWHELVKWFEFGSTNNIELCNTFRMVSGTLPKNRYKPSSNDLVNLLYKYSVEILKTIGYNIRYHEKNGIGTFEIHRELLRDPITNEPFIELQDDSSEEEESVKVEKYGFDQIFQDVPTNYEQIPLSSNTDSYNLLSSNMINETPFNTKCNLVPDNPITLNIPYSYAQFGHDMVLGDFNGDGIQDLAISAPFYSNIPEIPQTGAIFIINGKKSSSFKIPESTNILDIADKIIYAYNPHDENNNDPQSRFGWSLSVVDLNKDGIDDLAVSAPSFGAKKYIYSGKVYVYFGKKNEGLKENKADLEIYSEQDVLESDWQIEALGQYLSSGDVDGDGFDDLLIGCPYCGIYGKSRTFRLLHTGGVFAFLSSSDHKGNVTIFDYDWSIISPGDQQYEWFGYSINYFKLESMQNPIIIVGAPGYDDHLKAQMSGRIYGFEIIDKNPVKVFDLSGIEKFQEFGSSIITGDFHENGKKLLLVASKSETHEKKFPFYNKDWQAGAIRLIDMQYLKENKRLSDHDMILGKGLLALLHGSESFSHLGSSLLWDDDEKSFWSSEPFTYWESGQILKYSVRSLFDSSQGVSQESIVSGECLVGRERQARFGHKIIKFDFDGDGKKDLVVSSEHSNHAARLSGSVTIILK